MPADPSWTATALLSPLFVDQIRTWLSFWGWVHYVPLRPEPDTCIHEVPDPIENPGQGGTAVE